MNSSFVSELACDIFLLLFIRCLDSMYYELRLEILEMLWAQLKHPSSPVLSEKDTRAKIASLTVILIRYSHILVYIIYTPDHLCGASNDLITKVESLFRYNLIPIDSRVWVNITSSVEIRDLFRKVSHRTFLIRKLAEN